MKAIEKAENVSITTDSWTSRATENYIAVTAHYVNEEWRVENFVLETHKFPESHTAENLAKCLKETVETWKLERNGKGPSVTTDNAANIVKAVKETGFESHIACFAHTLNLATQRGLKMPQMERLLRRVTRVVSFFHKSTSATSALTLMHAKLGLPKHRLEMDVSTRLNSTYDMLERYVQQQAAVFAAILELKKKIKDLVTLSDDDIHNIETILQVLRPIKTVTTKMCSQTHPTVSMIHPFKEMLLKHLKQSFEDNTLVADVKRVIRFDLESRYTGTVLDYLLTASAVDPRFKRMPYLDEAGRHKVYQALQDAAIQFHLSQVEAVRIKTEPGEQSGPAIPTLPSMPTTDLENEELQGEATEPVLKTENREEAHSTLSDLFGDVFVVKVEEGLSVYDRLDAEVKSYRNDEFLVLEGDPLLWWREGGRESIPPS
ncbi:E3 SUMO-protein ligase ZBED1-like [Haliotis asinina]|uniref:E3 SUMO-protein ligase ZBED1-like n=1 Tax=Haliotis asinina TaxID=109174 RepID=UPI0035326B64